MAEEKGEENFIKLKEDFQAYSKKNFCIPKHYEDDLETVLIPRGLVMDRVERMARDIHGEMKSGPIVVLCVLKGGYQFMKDLLHFINVLNANSGRSFQLGIDFIRVKSYVNDNSNGEVKVIGGDDMSNLTGKHVLIVEDIVETGKTMERLVALLKKSNPASIKVASLLVKRTGKPCAFTPDYIGFEIPNYFVVGYALDYNEYFRDLDHICVLPPRSVDKYRM
ncbi:hypoxanthine-guanine phosphoribosyltransferase-like [Rhopilema esculentum]|uniref:hypoxanthine-guanine phosphoribosyltransferase-like n=1 Tax=Rhopilema esculentum TaxID=499914 RepID=UPI0031DBFD1C